MNKVIIALEGICQLICQLKTTNYHIISKSQESRDSLPGWFWLTLRELIIKISAATIVTKNETNLEDLLPSLLTAVGRRLQILTLWTSHNMASGFPQRQRRV
jgi:hypothetical protein